MKKLFNLIKKTMGKEESEVTEVVQAEEPVQEPIIETEESIEELPTEEPEPVVVFEKCRCPENANKAQWQLDKRCMFCGKEFYSTILI